MRIGGRACLARAMPTVVMRSRQGCGDWRQGCTVRRRSSAMPTLWDAPVSCRGTGGRFAPPALRHRALLPPCHVVRKAGRPDRTRGFPSACRASRAGGRGRLDRQGTQYGRSGLDSRRPRRHRGAGSRGVRPPRWPALPRAQPGALGRHLQAAGCPVWGGPSAPGGEGAEAWARGRGASAGAGIDRRLGEWAGLAARRGRLPGRRGRETGAGSAAGRFGRQTGRLPGLPAGRAEAAIRCCGPPRLRWAGHGRRRGCRCPGAGHGAVGRQGPWPAVRRAGRAGRPPGPSAGEEGPGTGSAVGRFGRQIGRLPGLPGGRAGAAIRCGWLSAGAVCRGGRAGNRGRIGCRALGRQAGRLPGLGGGQAGAATRCIGPPSARSAAAAARSTCASPSTGPAICSPTGRPAPSMPQGREIAGSPSRFHG